MLNFIKQSALAFFATLFVINLAACNRAPEADGRKLLRVGHFPNITHAQALVAKALKAEGKDWFAERLGKDVEIQWFVYNAGPSAMEAIFADSIDITYVGPNPVLSAYSKSKGEEIRVIAGAANGGAALVVQGDGRITKPEDFRGRKLATPQLGNTQDVAARAWLQQNGFKISQLGGDVYVLPTSNPDQLALFQKQELDAVWTVEPWVSRLELEAKGKILLEQKEAITTVLASSVKALDKKKELVTKFTQAHRELTEWIIQNPDEAKRLVSLALKEETKRDFPATLANQAWPRLKFTSEIAREPFEALVKEAQSVGFLKDTASLEKLVVPLK